MSLSIVAGGAGSDAAQPSSLVLFPSMLGAGPAGAPRMLGGGPAGAGAGGGGARLSCSATRSDSDRRVGAAAAAAARASAGAGAGAGAAAGGASPRSFAVRHAMIVRMASRSWALAAAWTSPP